jgi:hypothetical protein
MNEKIQVSCYGFWPGVEDGRVGSGPPKSVYYRIGNRVKRLTLSSGEVNDLLNAASVSIYTPCSLQQMVGYIKGAEKENGGDLGPDFATSVFARIVLNPEQYTSDVASAAQLSSLAQDEMPKRWKEYFVVSPKKGGSSSRRENEVRGYLLGVRVSSDAGSKLSTDKARRYRSQAQGSQKLLRRLIPEYRFGVFDSEKRERLQSDILIELKRLEDALRVLGIPVSEEEKVMSQTGIGNRGGSTGTLLLKPGRKPNCRELSGPVKGKIGTAVFGKRDPDFVPGRKKKFVPPGLSEVVIPFQHVALQPAVVAHEDGMDSPRDIDIAPWSPEAYLRALSMGDSIKKILERMFEIREELLRLGFEFLGASSTLENASRLDELIGQRRMLEEELREGNSEFQKILMMMEKVF